MDCDVKKQEERTFLRERFLRMLTSLTGTQTDIMLCDNNQVRAKFGASDVDIMHIQVNNLKTPIGTQPSALVRTSDILYVKFDVDSHNAEN